MSNPGWPSPPPIGAANDASALSSMGKATPPAKPMARLRLNSVNDCGKELRKLYRESRAGTLAVKEATSLAYLLNMLANILATSDLESRLEQLEK
ncbi:MAG: hypothetical protein WKF52_03510 [Sphingomicrobium sp.]